jgi:hypothetical protein
MNIIAAIVGLLLVGSPPAVRWTIRPVIIDAIQGQSLWAFAHVVKEVLEGIDPSFADFNPAPAVIRKIFAFRIQAPILHAVPRFICPSVGPSVSCPEFSDGHFFSVQAATAPSVSGSQTISLARPTSAARTQANTPSSPITDKFRFDRKPSKSLSKNADSLHGANIRSKDV